MKLTTYEIIYLISNFFTIFIIHRFMNLFFSKSNENNVWKVISYLSYFIVTSLAYLTFDIPILTLVLNWLILFTISLTYRETMRNRLMYSTYILIFMLFPELIVGAITGYFHFSILSDGNYQNGLGVIITRIMTFSESLLLQNYRSTRERQNVGWNLWLSSILIPILTMTYEIMFVSSDNASQCKVIISVVILFLINIASFYLYDSLSKSYVRQSKLSILETENKLYNKQCEIMHASTKELQAYRHDMNNHFITLSHLIEAGQYAEAEKQLGILGSLTKNKSIYSASGNVIIDGLINYKLQNAQSDGIKVKTEIAVPNQLEIETTDMVTIIGNLIDNALKALRDVPSDQRSLILKIVFDKQRLIIRISNPYVGEIFCKDGKIISTKRDTRHHGYGLNNIAKAVNQYKGYMDIDYSENTFTVDIVLYI